MVKNHLVILLIFFSSMQLFGNQKRTFSCGGIYDGSGPDFPFVSSHAELDYMESESNFKKTLQSEDPKFKLIGNIDIQDSKEFLKITVESKESGMIIINNNSQLGFPSDGSFNFVYLSLQNFATMHWS